MVIIYLFIFVVICISVRPPFLFDMNMNGIIIALNSFILMSDMS